MSHSQKLKSSIMNEGAYACAMHELKSSNISRDDLSKLCKDVIGISTPSKATKKDLFRRLEMHGAAERRHANRAAVSRCVMPA